MNILAVETSGFEGSIAIKCDGNAVDERFLSAEGRRHAQTLVMEVKRLLLDHHLSPSAIDAVAVSVGPGSFTGLRVGVVFAKTFAWANGCDLIAVDTLQALAQQIEESPKHVGVISDAQRQEVFMNTYHWDSDKQMRRSDVETSILPVAELAESSELGAEIITGPGLEKFGPQLEGMHSLADGSFWQPRAVSVAEIGSKLVADGVTANIETLEPVYIRRSYAEEKATGPKTA